jgi:hypothetical protein
MKSSTALFVVHLQFEFTIGDTTQGDVRAEIASRARRGLYESRPKAKKARGERTYLGSPRAVQTLPKDVIPYTHRLSLRPTQSTHG